MTHTIKNYGLNIQFYKHFVAQLEYTYVDV